MATEFTPPAFRTAIAAVARVLSSPTPVPSRLRRRRAPRRPLWLLTLLGLLALALPACTSTTTIEAPITIRFPSPATDNNLETPMQSVAGRIISLALGLDAGGTHARYVYAASWPIGLWRSDDGGDHWQQLTGTQPGDDRTTCVDATPSLTTPACALPPLTVYDIAVSPADPKLVFVAAAGDGRDTPRDGIYRSDDAGVTWSLVHQSRCNGAVGWPSEIAFAPDNPTLLWAAGGCEIAYSTTVTKNPPSSSAPPAVGAAGTWTSIATPDGGAVTSLAVAAASDTGGRWVYGCGPNGVYDSADGGTDYATDTGGKRATCGDAHMLAVAPDDPHQLYAAQPGPASSNGYSYFHVDKAPSPPQDGVRCDPAAATPDQCGGSLWLATFQAPPPPNSQQQPPPLPQWSQQASPPLYGGNLSTTLSGSAMVRTQARTGGGYFVYLMDQSSLNVSQAPITADGWHRLDGPNASELCPTADAATCNQGAAAQFIHPDPHAMAFTADFALTLAPAAGVPAAYAHDAVATCGGGTLYEANDGGVYRSADCGLPTSMKLQPGQPGIQNTWVHAKNLYALGAHLIAGLPRAPGKAPALYMSTFDNNDWQTLDGGAGWTDFEDCGDCDAIWTDPLQPDLMMEIPRDGNVAIVKTDDGSPPNLGEVRGHECPASADALHDLTPRTCMHNVGLPPSLYTTELDQNGRPVRDQNGQVVTDLNKDFVANADDWARGTGAYRMAVLTVPGGAASAPFGDLVMVAPYANYEPNVLRPDPSMLVVWRYQVPAGSTKGSWQREGTGADGQFLPGAALPKGATVIQAAGGHDRPTFYVADRVPDRGSGYLYDIWNDGDHLYRSHRGADGVLDGWDCIVPGPAVAGVHDGHCAAAAVSDASHAGQAWTFASDPYDATVVYVVDSDGVKLSTDGGDTWRLDASLTGWLTDSGAITPACRVYCVASQRLRELSDIEFVPGEPGTRFALGEAGVFYTTTGASGKLQVPFEAWHRLLAPSALACLPGRGYFDPVADLGRTLYVSCVGRSLLSISGIPSSGDERVVIERVDNTQGPAHVIDQPNPFPYTGPPAPDEPTPVAATRSMSGMTAVFVVMGVMLAPGGNRPRRARRRGRAAILPRRMLNRCHSGDRWSPSGPGM